jgi:hypothetical protein
MTMTTAQREELRRAEVTLETAMSRLTENFAGLAEADFVTRAPTECARVAALISAAEKYRTALSRAWWDSRG